MKNPIPLVMMAFSEATEVKFLGSIEDEKTLSFDFFHISSERPYSPDLHLTCQLEWDAVKTLRICMIQQEMAFLPWEGEKMGIFFFELMKEVAPYIADFAPEEEEFLSSLSALSTSDDPSKAIPGYVGWVDCSGLDNQSIVDLAIGHLAAGPLALSLCQEIFASLQKGDRSTSFKKRIPKIRKLEERWDEGLGEILSPVSFDRRH